RWVIIRVFQLLENLDHWFTSSQVVCPGAMILRPNLRPRIVFLTVMPSPYQRQLFQALHSDGRIEIRVLYCARTVEDRNWSVTSLYPYEEVLPGGAIRWLDRGAHFNPSIYKILRNDTSSLFVLSNYSAPTTQVAMRYLTRREKRWVFWGEVPGFQQ